MTRYGCLGLVVMCTLVLLSFGHAYAQAAPQPRITSPTNGFDAIFGEQMTFSAVDDANLCHPTSNGSGSVVWHFRYQALGQANWQVIPTYRFTAGRLLGVGGSNRLIPMPGEYEIRAEMCGVLSDVVAFSVNYDAPLAGQLHPILADDPDLDHIDWDDVENDNHLTTAHFNVFWADTDDAGMPIHPTRPSVEMLGLLECTWSYLSRWMTSPLSDNSLFRHYQDYEPLSHVTFVVDGRPQGGGYSYPQGFGYARRANNSGVDWVGVHELFHVFDYAGNPLHNKRFDHRYEGNAYHLYHEAPTRIEQTVARSAHTLWGYRTDGWPLWTPLDLGLLELDYDAGPFWSYLINNFGDDFSLVPRETWEGPPTIDACALHAQRDSSNAPIRPHNLKLFEAWNARVRDRIRAELGADAELADYPDTCQDHQAPDKDFLYNGQTDPICSQTLEFEMSVLEELIAERLNEQGTPLEESLMLDFVIQFAQAFPPVGLLSSLPTATSFGNLPGINFSRGFNAAPPANCPDNPPSPVGIPDVSVPAGVNEHDFYARLKFNITEARAKYLRITANDDATLYVDGKAVIGQDNPEVVGNDTNPDFPNASTTYADQRYPWDQNHAPVSSVFPVGDPRRHTYEIEWVNRGDGRGNAERTCSASRSRYLLKLEWYDALANTFNPIAPAQIDVLNAEFWSGQGSGNPGFSAPIPDPLSHYDRLNYHPLRKEIQLRTVAEGHRPFLLPALGVHYHPIQCPAGYVGDLQITVHDDQLTHTRPSAHLMAIKPPGTVEWRGSLPGGDEGDQHIQLTCDGQSGAATTAGDPAFLLVVARRTRHGDPPNNTYGTMGAIHYTVMVDRLQAQARMFLPHVVTPIRR